MAEAKRIEPLLHLILNSEDFKPYVSGVRGTSVIGEASNFLHLGGRFAGFISLAPHHGRL